MWRTPVGEEFREFLNKWDAVCIEEKRDNQIRLLVDGQNFVFFFNYEDNIYAAHEPQRVTFARMKNPDEDDTDVDADEAHFKAFSLTKALSGKMAIAEPFYKDDFDKIDIIDREGALKTLKDQAKSTEPDRIATGAKAIMAALSQSQQEPNEPGVPLNQDESSISYIGSLMNKLAMKTGIGPETIIDMSVNAIAEVLEKRLPDIPDDQRMQFAAAIRQAATLNQAS